MRPLSVALAVALLAPVAAQEPQTTVQPGVQELPVGPVLTELEGLQREVILQRAEIASLRARVIQLEAQLQVNTDVAAFTAQIEERHPGHSYDFAAGTLTPREEQE
jgi:BMFP domain-containing protein YqiC